MSNLRTRVWFRRRFGHWCYRIYLTHCGTLGGYGYDSERAAREALAKRLPTVADVSL
jgi:hypothetical protein